MSVRTMVAAPLLAVATVVAVGAVAGSASADGTAAAGLDGTCDLGDVCFYCNSSTSGSMADFAYAVRDFGSDWQGAHDVVPPAVCQNLDNTYNENASFVLTD
jgi:hypothetical protein